MARARARGVTFYRLQSDRLLRLREHDGRQCVQSVRHQVGRRVLLDVRQAALLQVREDPGRLLRVNANLPPRSRQLAPAVDGSRQTFFASSPTHSNPLASFGDS